VDAQSQLGGFGHPGLALLLMALLTTPSHARGGGLVVAPAKQARMVEDQTQRAAERPRVAHGERR
jgi:hypothetical protein